MGEQEIRDVRGIENQFSPDQHGFAYVQEPFDFDGFEHHERILDEYLPWAESVIRKKIGNLDRLFIFGWRVSLTQRRRRLEDGSFAEWRRWIEEGEEREKGGGGGGGERGWGLIDAHKIS